MKGALVFGLAGALVAGVALALTLHFGHQLNNAWWLPLVAAGACGVVAFLLGIVAHLLTRGT